MKGEQENRLKRLHKRNLLSAIHAVALNSGWASVVVSDRLPQIFIQLAMQVRSFLDVLFSHPHTELVVEQISEKIITPQRPRNATKDVAVTKISYWLFRPSVIPNFSLQVDKQTNLWQ